MTPLAALSIAPIAFCNLTTRLPLNDAYPSRQHASRGRIDFSSNNPFDGLTQHVLGRKRRLMNNAATRRGIIVFKSNEINEGDAEKKTQQTDNNDESLFFELMSPITPAKPDQMSASSLAYLGDVLFELFIRSRYVWPSRRMSDLQNTVVSIVRAEAQSVLLKKFIDSYPLTLTEQGVLARGRNANLTARKKGKSTKDSGGASAYQDSTALEALLGYTYISDKNRFNDMINWMKLEFDELDSGFKS